MTIKITQILSFEERYQMNEDAIARGFYRDDRRIFIPGMAWFQPWYHDPEGADENRKSKRYGCRVMWPTRPENVGKGSHGLSRFYWDKWANIRPPICVVCPNGEQWEVDRVSNNGEGWEVTGTLPLISCSPSIVVDGYHGFLGTNGASPGQFTADIDGRPPNGVARA